MTGVNPQGVDVHSFKVPTTTELSHDYLWRTTNVLPERGRIGIFNRSYYAEVVVVRIHHSVLENERLPAGSDANPALWKERYEDINAFERHMSRNGTLILKFFLHLSKDEQQKRLLERVETPDKRWKLSSGDIYERKFWDRYQRAYAESLSNTSTPWAPWYVIPADHKWFARVAIASVIVAELEALNLTYPAVTDEQRANLAHMVDRLREPAAELVPAVRGTREMGHRREVRSVSAIGAVRVATNWSAPASALVHGERDAGAVAARPLRQLVRGSPSEDAHPT